MAKVGFWLKGAKGKLANSTIYQANGETLIREVVAPANPKTEKQIIQRIIMHTVMQAYSKMKEICDHSFEGVKKGQATMSYFMQQNVGFAREKVANMQAQGISFLNMYNFVPLGVKGFTPNQYQVSMGSLPRIDATLRDDDEAKAFLSGINVNTYQAIIEAYGLQRGDQLTFLMIDKNSDASFGQCNFHFCRVILDPTNADFTQAPLSTPFIDEETHKINLPSVRNEGNFSFGIIENKGLAFTYSGSLTCAAAAVIVSRKMNDKWLRSTAYLTYAALEEYNMQQCIDAAESGVQNQIYAAADAYLNNAGQGGGAAAEATDEPGTGGGGSSTAAAVTAATIGGNNITMGTLKSVAKPNGTSFPVTESLAVATNAAANGKQVVVKQGAQIVASATIENGEATISHAWEKDTNYTIGLRDDADSVAANTGFSFSYYEQSNGGGGFDSGGD